MSSRRRIDEQGRITLPEELRTRLGLEAGDAVVIEREDGSIHIRPYIGREAARSQLRGCVNADTRKRPVKRTKPTDRKRLWTENFPE